MIYRVDLHVHTSATLGASASLSDLARAARRAGIDAIAVTDQNCYTAVPLELGGVLMIPGCEITTLGGQILGVFLEQAPDFSRLTRHGVPTADEAVLEIHRCGGLAVLAHPFACSDANPARFPIRPDAVETISARASLFSPNANKRALLWAADHGRPKIGGSNAHSAQEVGNAYTEIACQRLTRAFLKEAMDLGHCRPVSVRDTSHTCCGFVDLANARRLGSKAMIVRSTARLGLCKLHDLLHTDPNKKKAHKHSSHRP